MVPRQKSSIAQISFVIHIKIDQYPSLRSVPRATSKSHESKNKQILQPLSKSCPSVLRVTTKTNKSSNHCFIICCGQGLVVSHCLIICCGQGLVASYCFTHLPPKPNFTVQNERFARFYHLPWSRVGGLLLSYHFLWSGVGGQLLFYHICHQNQSS